MLALPKFRENATPPPQPAAERRLSERLPIRRLNVDISGSVVHTSNISKQGVQLVCPVMRFPSLEKQLRRQKVEMVVELPTGRHITAQVGVRYVCESDDEILIGVKFIAFNEHDERGWMAYMDWFTSASELRAHQAS